MAKLHLPVSHDSSEIILIFGVQETFSYYC